MDSCPSEGSVNLKFKAKRPHFFKIILDETIRQGKLGIPRKFVRRYGNHLLSVSQIILKVPSGAKWQVELVKYEDEIWLQNGWPEFADYYSLSCGSFLVFEFDSENCYFDVLIFDKSATEIDYPFNSVGENEIVEILEEKSAVPVSRPRKRMKQENCKRLEFAAKRDIEDKYVKSTRRLTCEEKANALHIATSNYKSENPYFSVVMQPTYVVHTFKLIIPASFAKKHFREKGSEIILNSMDGETWSVQYNLTLSNGKELASIYHGWRKFAEDNHLEVGDVCVFELIDHAETSLKVIIFRDIQSLGNNKHLKYRESSSNSEAEAFKEFTSVHAFFKVIIRPSYLKHGYLCLRRRIMAKFMKQNVEKAMLQVDNRQWPVKLIILPSTGEVRLSAGFAAFANENCLQVGDGCIFEFINTDQILLLNVSIFRNVS